MSQRIGNEFLRWESFSFNLNKAVLYHQIFNKNIRLWVQGSTPLASLHNAWYELYDRKSKNHFCCRKLKTQLDLHNSQHHIELKSITDIWFSTKGCLLDWQKYSTTTIRWLFSTNIGKRINIFEANFAILEPQERKFKKMKHLVRRCWTHSNRWINWNY